jgi:hypothetical protein
MTVPIPIAIGPSKTRKPAKFIVTDCTDGGSDLNAPTSPVTTVAASLAFYVAKLFSANAVFGPVVGAASIAALGVAMALAGPRARNVASWSVATFVILPSAAHTRENVVRYYLTRGEANHRMLDSAVEALHPHIPGTTVFISGVEPIHNPFWMRPGNALNVAFKDSDLNVEVGQAEPGLKAKFCETRGARRFLRFDGTRATDVTRDIERHCDHRKAA